MLLITLAAALAVQPALPAQAIRLFESVCLNGGAQLKQNQIERIHPGRLPRAARFMFNFISAGERRRDKVLEPIAASRLPAVVYRVAAEEDTYLIVPDSDAESGYRSTCAVFVDDDLYFEGKRAVARLTYGTDANITKPASTETSLGVGISGYVVTVARDDGSTLLAAVKNPEYAKMGKEEK